MQLKRKKILLLVQQREETILMHIPKRACTDQPSWSRVCTAEWLVDICSNVFLPWQSNHKLHTCQSKRNCTRDSPCSMEGRGNNHISVEKRIYWRSFFLPVTDENATNLSWSGKDAKNSVLNRTNSIFILFFFFSVDVPDSDSDPQSGTVRCME